MKCLLCYKEMKWISNTHLKKHNISKREYANIDIFFKELLKLEMSKLGKKRKGIKLSDETKRKISFSKKGTGIKETNTQWKGGISNYPYPPEWTIFLKRKIIERDNSICKICNKKGICVHHIDYNKNNCNPNNLITLCKSCHIKTNAHRDRWLSFFRHSDTISGTTSTYNK